MHRQQALELVESTIKTRNLVKHMLAVEAGMRALAPRFEEDPDRWGLVGLLHDLDYALTKDNPELHGLKTVELLEAQGITDKEMLDAILAHADHQPPTTPMGQALCAVDPLTGLIVAAALVHPQRLAGLTPDNVLNRYKEKGFARSASREGIASCQQLGMDLADFFNEVLTAMQAVSRELGLS